MESTQPTKTLMTLAEYIDTHCGARGGGVREGEREERGRGGEGGRGREEEGRGEGGLREWFLGSKGEVLELLAEEVERCERGKRQGVPDTHR